jgi:alpha-1,3-fucosyltransferase
LVAGPTSDHAKCWKKIAKEYKFYLAFENSLCKDFITERFFDAMSQNIVPVVLGGSMTGNDYLEVARAPKHSFVDALRDFPNPARLAEYLTKISSSPELYAEYFWWKDFYRTVNQSPMREYCRICERLHASEEEKRKTIHNLTEWWHGEGECTIWPKWPNA